MTRIEEIQAAVESLPPEDYARFHKWFVRRDWDGWDGRIEADSASGKLDFLLREAREESAKGLLRDL